MQHNRGGTVDSSGEAAEHRSSAAPGKTTLTAGLSVQRKAPSSDAATASASAPAALISDDTAQPQPGQLTRSQFLARLHGAVVATAGESFGPMWSASACPSIERWFARNAQAEPAALERLLQRYTGLQGARSAADYIAPACARLRDGIARSQTGEDVSGELTAAGLPTAPEAAAEHQLPAAAAGGAPEAAAAGGAPVVQKKQASGGGADRRDDASHVLAGLGPGVALEAGTASRMAGAFGENFGDVRIHTDAAASSEANRQGALAFTVGNHIAFGAGQYAPGAAEGDALLAHELAHVVQQRGGSPSADGGVQRMAEESSGGDALEQDADQAAAAVVGQLHGGGKPRADSRASPARAARYSLQRCSKDQKPEAKDTKLPKLLTDFSADFPAAGELIAKDTASMKLINEAVAAGVKYGGQAEDGPAYTIGDTVYVPKTRTDKVLAAKSFLFELNNAIRKPKFDKIDKEAAKGSKGSLTAEDFATQTVSLEVEGMLRMGEIWFSMKHDLGGGKELDKYDADFYFSEYQAFRDGKKTKEDIVQEVLARTYKSGPNAGKTVKQFYMDQYKDLSGGK